MDPPGKYYLGAPDETKAQIYQACDVPALKHAILLGCGEDDRQTIALGMQDVFDPRRFASHPVAALLLSTHAGTNAILQSALEGEDKAALRGLAQNHTLPAPYLDRVERRLHELGAKYDAWEARQRLKDIHEAQAPEDPDELFGEEGKQGGFLEGKVNFIGKKLIATPMK